MKTKICLLVIFLFCLGNLGYSQTGIGAFSVHDGGFENHTATLAGGNTTNAALSTSLWTASTTANITRTLTSTGGRSGPKYVTLGSTNGTAKNFYTPQIAGSFAANTTYQVQFWYKTASTTALDASTVDIYVNNTTATQAPPIGTVKSVAAGLTTSVSTWTKVSVSITTAVSPAAGSFGVAGLTIDAATAGYAADIDDFVVYQANSADTSAPSTPGTVTATAASSSTATVSWGAASGGVDGGGYVVVRFATTAPSASDDPLQNGIYKFNNAIGAGVVRYIGTSTSFTDTSLSPGVDYYYKVYTVDKAFNYSSETTTSTPVQALSTTYYYKGTGALTDVTNWGLNTDGTGTNPSNFTDIAQVFEIRNTTAVALDGSWTVGTDPANGTKVRLGNTDQAAITLTLNSGASILPAGTGNLDVMAPPSGKQTVIYKGTTAISFGNIFDTNLEVVYDGVTISSTTTKSFGTITIKNGANVTFTATPVIKNISVDATSTLVAPTNATSYITIPSGGAVTINGTVRVPKLTGFVSSNVGTAGSSFADFQFIGTENLTLGANSIVEYARDATGAQTVTARTDYKNVTVSGTSPKSVAGSTTIAGTFTINQTGSLVTLSADTTVNGTLVFTSGKIDTGSNNLILGSAATISGAGTGTGWVIGNLRKTTTSGSSPSFTYTIGDSNYYTPLALTFAGNTSANGTLTAKTTAGDHAQIATSGIIAANSINRTWTLTNSNLAGFTSYNAAFTYATQDNDSGALPQFFAARLYAGSSWSNLTTSGTPTSTSFSASAVTSFGDFAIGQVCINPTTAGVVSGTQSVCENGIPSSFSSTSAASGFVGNLEYKWQSSTNNSTFTDISGATSSTYSAAAGLTVTTYYKRLARVDCKSDWTGAAESNTITVTVNSIATPTFTQVSTICSGASLSALPTTSNNAITGTWSPAVNNMATTSYTFTPTTGLCASTANMSITVNPSVTYYRDNDTDGYGDAASTSSSCTGAPSGYVTNATDCNDTNAGINPIATEVFDGIDNNCNGQTDEGVSPNVPTASAQVLVTGATVNNLVASGSTIAGYGAPALNWYLSATGGSSLSGTTVLATNTYYVSQTINGVESARTAVAVTIIPSNPIIAASFCGTVLSNIETTIYCSNVVGGTKYRFTIINASTGASVVYESTVNGFNFLQLSSNNSFNTLYGVKCAVFINGAWSADGNSCTITTPAVPASSKIIDAQCGTTLSSVDNTLYCGQSYGAQGYRFEVSSGGTTRTIDRSVNYMQLSSLSGGANFGTTYSVRVAVLYGATYGAYGAACNITTPSLPSQTKVNTTQCGSTLASKWRVLYCGAVAGATAYNFEWTNGGTTLTYTSAVPNMQLGNYTGWALNTTYSVRVAIQFGGTWQTYGTACNVTTPASFARHTSMEEGALSVKAVPNPFETEFVLMAQGGNQNPIQVTVYDMLGKQMDQFNVEANELENRSIGNGYTSGIYNVVIAQGDDQQVVRLIKK